MKITLGKITCTFIVLIIQILQWVIKSEKSLPPILMLLEIYISFMELTYYCEYLQH